MFLSDPSTPEALAYLEKDRGSSGYVMNLERAWAWRPDVSEAFVALRSLLMDQSAISRREIAVMVCATAHARSDSYCSLAWGARLADLASAELAAGILRGADDEAMSARERELRQWAEQVVRDPNGASSAQIDAMRRAGLSDREIFEATVYIALRLAFSTVNDALGARPDRQLVDAAPPEVQEAVTYGRAPA